MYGAMNNTECVDRMSKDSRTDVKKRDYNGNNALSWSCYSYPENIPQIINHPEIDNDDIHKPNKQNEKPVHRLAYNHGEKTFNQFEHLFNVDLNQKKRQDKKSVAEKVGLRKSQNNKKNSNNPNMP